MQSNFIFPQSYERLEKGSIKIVIVEKGEYRLEKENHRLDIKNQRKKLKNKK